MVDFSHALSSLSAWFCSTPAKSDAFVAQGKSESKASLLYKNVKRSFHYYLLFCPQPVAALPAMPVYISLSHICCIDSLSLRARCILTTELFTVLTELTTASAACILVKGVFSVSLWTTKKTRRQAESAEVLLDGRGESYHELKKKQNCESHWRTRNLIVHVTKMWRTDSIGS